LVADAQHSQQTPSFWGRIRGPWEEQPFRWYWAGSLAQAMSQGMQFLVIGWLVLEVTGDKTQLGLTVSLYGLPNIAFLMAGGIIADRMDRKLLLMVTQAMVGALIAGLAVLTITDLVALWHIYLSAALLGVLQALNMPARLAMLADLVGERRLLDAVAQFNAAQHAGRIVGPPVAGVLIDLWGMGVVLVLNAACYGASVVLLVMVRGTFSRPETSRQSLLSHIGEGLSVIRDTPMLLTVLVMTCFFGGFGMAHLQVIPAFAKEQLGSGASEVGLLLLGSGIGALAGSMTLTFMHRAWLFRWLLFSLVTFTVLLTLFAWSGSFDDLTGTSWSGWFWVTWVFTLLVGVVAIGWVWPLTTTITQLSSPAELRGRVLGVLHLVPGLHFLGAWPLTLAAAGMGWPLAITGAAGVCLLVTLTFGLGRKTGRELAMRPATA
jgi:MFS family permease